METYVTRPPRPDLSDPLEVLLYENDSQSWFSKWFKPPVKNTFVHYEQTEQPEDPSCDCRPSHSTPPPPPTVSGCRSTVSFC